MICKVPAVDLKRCCRRPESTHHMVHDPAFQTDELMLDSLSQAGDHGGLWQIKIMRAEQRAKKRHAKCRG